MMKPFKNYQETQVIGEKMTLPVGAYLVEIKSAAIVTYGDAPETFEKLEICFDICEGEYKGFYANEYRQQQQEKRKWKGVLRLYLPKDDGSDKDEWNKRKFKSIFVALESSNPGYHFDWDEKKIVGLKAACVFRNEEWLFNGRTGWKTQPFKLISIDDYRENRYQIPDDKALKNKAEVIEFPDIYNDDDLPFN